MSFENCSSLSDHGGVNSETPIVLSGDLEEWPSHAAKVHVTPLGHLQGLSQAAVRGHRCEGILLAMPNLIFMKPKYGAMNCLDFSPQLQQRETHVDSPRCL